MVAPYDMLEVEMSLSVEVHDVQQIMGRTTVEESEDSSTLAYSASAKLTEELISALENEAMVPKENITTSSVDLWPIEEYYDGSYVDIGYEASTDIVLDVAAPSSNETGEGVSISQIYSIASSLEDDYHEVRVYGFYPYVSNELRQDYDLKLFALALEDAQGKAETLAEGAGMKLGSVLTMSDQGISVHAVDESSSDYYSYYYSYSPSSTYYPLGRGEELTQKIYVEYELIEADNITHNKD